MKCNIYNNDTLGKTKERSLQSNYWKNIFKKIVKIYELSTKLRIAFRPKNSKMYFTLHYYIYSFLVNEGIRFLSQKVHVKIIFSCKKVFKRGAQNYRPPLEICLIRPWSWLYNIHIIKTFKELKTASIFMIQHPPPLPYTIPPAGLFSN